MRAPRPAWRRDPARPTTGATATTTASPTPIPPAIPAAAAAAAAPPPAPPARAGMRLPLRGARRAGGLCGASSVDLHVGDFARGRQPPRLDRVVVVDRARSPDRPQLV